MLIFESMPGLPLYTQKRRAVTIFFIKNIQEDL